MADWQKILLKMMAQRQARPSVEEQMARHPRSPMDERLPDGRSIGDGLPPGDYSPPILPGQPFQPQPEDQPANPSPASWQTLLRGQTQPQPQPEPAMAAAAPVRDVWQHNKLVRNPGEVDEDYANRLGQSTPHGERSWQSVLRHGAGGVPEGIATLPTNNPRIRLGGGNYAGAAIGGGIRGILESLLSPNADAESWKQQQLGQVRGNIKARQSQREGEADIALKTANANRANADALDIPEQRKQKQRDYEDKVADEIRKQQDRLNETLAEPFTDPKTGKMWIRYKNDPSRQTPFTINGQQVQLEKDPTTGQYLKPEEIARNSATRAATLATVGNANAGFDQQRAIAEQERQLKLAGINEEANGLYGENDTLGTRNAEIAKIMQAPHNYYVTENGKEVTKTMTPQEFADSTEGRELQKEFAANESKGKANLTKANSLRAQANVLNTPTPTRTPNEAPATAQKYAGQTFPSPESLQKYFPKKKPDEIRRIVELNGGTFQQ